MIQRNPCIKSLLACLTGATLAACGSSLNTGAQSGSGTAGGNTPTNNSPYSCTTTAPTSTRFLLVAGFGDNSLARYSINADGSLQSLDCFPYPAASGFSQPTGLAYDTTSNLLFGSNYTSNTVTSFQMNANGSFAPAAGSPYTAGVSPWAVSMDTTHHYLYAANGASTPAQSLSGYSVNSSNGTLTPIPVTASPNGQSFALAMDPNGTYLYAANYLAPDSVSAYSISATTGALTLIGDYSAGGAYPRSVVVDPSGKYVYVANTNRIGDQCGNGAAVGNTITAFSIGTGGALTQIGMFPSGLAPQALAAGTTSGTEYLYSADYCSDDITTYAIGTTGALTVAGTAQEAAQSGPHGMTLTPDGFLYVANYLGNSVNAFHIGGNGLPTGIGTYAGPSNASALVATETLP